MPKILVQSEEHISFPHILLIALEVVLFLCIFTWICLQSVTFFTILSVGGFFVGCIVLMVAGRKGHFAYAIDIVAIFLSMLMAFPVAAIEVQRRYRASTGIVERFHSGCLAYRTKHNHWPERLSELVPTLIADAPCDSWGNELSYRLKSKDAPTVGFIRKAGGSYYYWAYDGRVWCSSWGAMSSEAPKPPMFVFHY